MPMQLSSLVLVEHGDNKISNSTFPVLTAAEKLGGEITALVAGQNVQSVAKEASEIGVVNKVSTYISAV